MENPLLTERLILRPLLQFDTPIIQNFYEENADHLRPWQITPLSQTTDFHEQVQNWLEEQKEGRSIRFLLFLKNDPEGKVIGLCNFTQIFRGGFQACYLGYQMGKKHEGKGLMYEALKTAIEYMFKIQNLHRIMANYMPSNKRSGALLKRLGFTIEGKAEKYLLINGYWEDHILTALLTDQE